MARLRAGSIADTHSSLHRVKLTNEAVCDYEYLFQMCINAELPSGLTIWEDIKNECEFCIAKNKKLWNKRYFKLKHIDPYSNEFIYLFFKQESVQLNFYVWNLVGVCFENDWSQELEDSGKIRSWIDTSVTPKDDGDWVVDMQIRQIENRLERLYEEDRKAYEQLLIEFIEEQEEKSNSTESDGISVKQLNRRHQREIQRIKKNGGVA